MGDPRPIPDDPSQDEQATLLAVTGNAPTSEDEEALLEAEFGPADTDGVYGAPSEGDVA